MIIQYVFPGMIFIGILFFCTDRKMPAKNVLIPSVCISYIIKQLLDLSPANCLHSLFSQVIVAVLTSYLISRIILSQTFNRVILPRLGINRTANDSFWTDLITNDMWIMVYGEKSVFYGAVDLVDSKGGSHFIVLRDVSVMDYDGNVIEEKTEPDRRMMFDMTKYKRFDIISDHKIVEKTRKLLF